MFSTPAYINDNYQISRSNLPPELQIQNHPTVYLRPLPEGPTCTSNSTCSSYLLFLTYFQCQLMAPSSTQVKQSLTSPASSQPIRITNQDYRFCTSNASSPSPQHQHHCLSSESHHLPRWLY